MYVDKKVVLAASLGLAFMGTTTFAALGSDRNICNLAMESEAELDKDPVARTFHRLAVDQTQQTVTENSYDAAQVSSDPLLAIQTALTSAMTPAQATQDAAKAASPAPEQPEAPASPAPDQNDQQQPDEGDAPADSQPEPTPEPETPQQPALPETPETTTPEAPTPAPEQPEAPASPAPDQNEGQMPDEGNAPAGSQPEQTPEPETPQQPALPETPETTAPEAPAPDNNAGTGQPSVQPEPEVPAPAPEQPEAPASPAPDQNDQQQPDEGNAPEDSQPEQTPEPETPQQPALPEAPAPDNNAGADQPSVQPEPEVPAPAPEQPENPYAQLNQQIVQSALTLVGTTDGWQCTEVATQALALAGVSDARVLWPDQYQGVYGTYTNNPTPGNLIYYDNGGRGIDHIAVYIGDGQAVHGNYWIDGQPYTTIASVNINGGAPQYIQVQR